MQAFKVQPKEDNTTDIFAVCIMCKAGKTLNVPTASLSLWLTHRQLIQTALPMLSAADRELLISGTCDTCWKELFSDDN